MPFFTGHVELVTPISCDPFFLRKTKSARRRRLQGDVRLPDPKEKWVRSNACDRVVSPVRVEFGPLNTRRENLRLDRCRTVRRAELELTPALPADSIEATQPNRQFNRRRYEAEKKSFKERYTARSIGVRERRFWRTKPFVVRSVFTTT